MAQKISRLFGERVALQLVDEEYEGLIVPAPTQERMHMLAKVVAVGDEAKWVKPGEIVYWQWNKMIEAMCKYQMNGTPIFILSEKDMIAKLSSRLVKLDTFQVVGEWCLVRKESEQAVGRILLPNAVAHAPEQSFVHHFLVQKGEDTQDKLMEIGDELIVDRARANPLRISGEDFFYIQKPFVVGVYSDS